MPKVSIIIVSYNTLKLTLNCIKSVLKDRSVKSKEIIVVDNGSSDGSTKALEKLVNSTSNKITLIKNNKNLGFSKANNVGIKVSKGEYIVLLNSDTIIKAGTLKKLINFAQDNKSAGVVVPQLINSSGSIQASCFNFPTITGAFKEFILKKQGSFSKFAPQSKKPVEVDLAVMAAFLITPKAIKKVGLLNEDYFMYFEDIDYCRKVKKAGLKVFYLPNVKVTHLHGKSGTNSSLQRDRLVESSKIYHGVFKHYIINSIIRVSQLLNLTK